MRTHTYTMNKGYDAPHKGQSLNWEVPVNLSEAIPKFFKDEATLVRTAVAQLNIKKGHAVQAASVERPDKDGKGDDGSKLSIADLTKIASETMMDTEIRERGTGSQKENAKIGASAKQKAAELAKNATPAELALLRKLGLAPEEAPTPEVAKPTGHKR